MTSDERRDQLLLYAAGQLDPAEEAEVRAELSNATPQELGMLAEAEAVIAQLSMSLPPVALSSQVRSRLMEQIAAPVAPASTSRHFWLPLLASLAAGLAIGLGILWHNDRAARQKNSIALQQQISKLDAERQDAVASALEAKAINASLQRSADVLHAENVKLVSLSAKDSNAVANVFWDRSHSQWTVSVFKLKPLTPQQVYELWFITKEGKPVAAGDLLVNADGQGVTTVNVPGNLELAAAGITTETRGVNHDAPTPPIHLSGAVN